jgi:hypothetical protein
MNQEDEARVDGGFLEKLTEQNLTQLIEFSRDHPRHEGGEDKCIPAVPGVVDLSFVFSLLLLADSDHQRAINFPLRNEDQISSTPNGRSSRTSAITEEKNKTK